MKRRYLIPCAVALLGHVLFLFGFSRPVATIDLPVEPDPVRIDPIVYPVDLVIVDPEENPADSVRRDEPAEPLPGAPEPRPMLAPDRQEMKMPPVRPMDVTIRGLDTIPRDWLPGGEAGISDLISSDMLDNPPTARLQAPPAYPFSARQSGRGAEVVVAFIVNERGEVIMPRVVRSTDPDFDEATLRAVAKWRFEPGRRNGRPVRFQMSVPVRFNVRP